jgi:secondary thiamine-phosphate synthase enzyme
MKYLTVIEVKTHQSIEFVDITAEVKRFVADSGVQEGIILVYTPHTTAGITINENADPAVMADIRHFIRRLVPQESYFTHMEGNSPSHIMSSFVGASETLIIDGGRLVLGTWQGIYFGEFDGPRTRKAYLKIIPQEHS